ncbi:MAG: hypothetical protein AAFZ87_15710 [Planctomycetota bacterium]
MHPALPLVAALLGPAGPQRIEQDPGHGRGAPAERTAQSGKQSATETPSEAAVQTAPPAAVSSPAAESPLTAESSPAAESSLTAGPSASETEPADWRAREAALLTRIAELEDALRREQERSIARTEEWVAYVTVLRGFSPAELPAPPDFIAEELVPEPDPAVEAERLRQGLALARGDALEPVLRALLVADGVRTLDFLELGSVRQEGERSFAGPVVARVLDDRGRLTGMLSAERMRIEVSRAARAATLVLEDGYQTRRGVRRTFDGLPLAADQRKGSGTRRILLPAIDPNAWAEALPGLVDEDVGAPFVDDGTWNVTEVRASLGRLLRDAARDRRSGWRLVALGGVRGNELRDVQLVERAPAGAGSLGPERRVFADRARIRVPEGGPVTLELEEGTVRRGDRTAPFLDGRYRIVLPFADAAAWRAAPVPRAAEARPGGGPPR